VPGRKFTVSEATRVLSAEGERLLALRLSGATATRSAPPAPRPAASTGGRAPLSLDQQRLWFIDQATPGLLAYNVNAAYRLRGHLDTGALRAALRFVVNRHEVLRARFIVHDQEPFQVTTDVPAELLTVADLSQADDPLAAAAEYGRSRVNTPFQLDSGPLFRAWLARIGPDDHVLGIVVHHTVFDRESLEVWAAEVSTAYAALRSGRRPALAPLAAQYADYAAWQRRQAAGADLRRQFGYWRHALRGVPVVIDLPTDRPRPARPTYRAGVVPVALAADRTRGLHALAARYRTTLLTVTLAAFQGLLLRYCPLAPAVVTGGPVNGRGRVEFEGLIGFFTRSLPVVGTRAAGGDPDPAFTALVEQARDAFLAAHAHQDLPLEQIVRLVAPPRDLACNPLFQVWFDLVVRGPAASAGLALPGLAVTEFDTDLARTRFDLELHLEQEQSGALGGRLLYAADLFDEATAAALARHYEHFLAAVAQRPGTALSAVPLTGDQERDTIVHEWGVAR
jgi:hypothetical protein